MSQKSRYFTFLRVVGILAALGLVVTACAQAATVVAPTPSELPTSISLLPSLTLRPPTDTPPPCPTPPPTGTPTLDPRTPTALALLTQASETQIVAVDSVETSEDTQITEETRLGEFGLTYPPWMRPSTSDSVILTIIIPEELLSISLESVSRKDISPQSAPAIGSLEQDRGNFLIDQLIRVEMDSSTIQIKDEYPQVQSIRFVPNSPTYWVWSIIAPQVEGSHRLNLKVFLDEESDSPSWFRTYQIEVLQPTPTPILISTPILTNTLTSLPTYTLTPTVTPTPTDTLVPTPTSTPTPTPSVWQQINDQRINILITLISAAILGLVTAIGGLVRSNLRRRDKIRILERKAHASRSENERTKLNDEIQQLREIRWWQFWR